MKKNIKSVGVDLSLTKTGFVIIENGKVIMHKVIKSEPDGDRPIDEIQRISTILFNITSELQLFEKGAKLPDIVTIEGLAFLARGTSLVQLAGLNYMLREDLHIAGVPFLIVAPMTLKRFATGKGNSEKDHMILEAYKKYKIESIDNNEADALFLASIGCMMMGYTKPTTKYEEETMTLLSKQLDKKHE